MIDSRSKFYACLATLVLLGGCQGSNSQVDEVQTVKFVKPSFLPNPPIGFEWKLISNMSDEFTQDQLDSSKWRDHITTWKGRPPARFFPENVSVNDGMLRLKTSIHPNPDDVFTMGGTSVSGKHSATFGYFESRVKGSKVKMSTTFWLHSDRDFDRHLGCEKAHSSELDILEMIGGWPDEVWTNVMHSNTHYKPRKIDNGKCVGAPNLSKGVKYDTGKNLSDDFHTYSMWWVTPNQMHYYFDGELTGTVNLAHDNVSLPFDGEMSLRMVVETYTWQQKFAPPGVEPYPTNAELNDPAINTAYYDHVRSYKLRASSENLIKNAGFETTERADNWQLSGTNTEFTSGPNQSYTEAWGLKVGPDGVAEQSLSLKPNMRYQLTFYAKNLVADQGARIQLTDSDGTELLGVDIVSTDFKKYTLNIDHKTLSNAKIKIYNAAQSASIVDNISLLTVL